MFVYTNDDEKKNYFCLILPIIIIFLKLEFMVDLFRMEKKWFTSLKLGYFGVARKHSMLLIDRSEC